MSPAWPSRPKSPIWCRATSPHNYKVVPVSRLGNKLFLAMADPLNVLAVDDVKRITKLEVAPLIASEKAILDKLTPIRHRQRGIDGRHHPGRRQTGAKPRRTPTTSKSSQETLEDVNLDQLAASSEEAPVIKLANLILVQAIKDRASDIHIEPFRKHGAPALPR